MFSGFIIGIFNIAVILLGFGVIFGAFWLTDHNINTFDPVTIPPPEIYDEYDLKQYGVPETTIDISSILRSAITGASMGLKVAGGFIFGFGIWGFVAFCCHIRWMCWLYILLLLCVIVVEVAWGIASIAAYDNDKFPVYDSYIKNDIHGLFTGSAIPDYDVDKYGDFYCMDVQAFSSQVPKAFFDGYFTKYFTESINKPDFTGLNKCVPPNINTTDAQCVDLSNQCEDNITLWLIRQVYYVGLMALILACATLCVAFLCMYNLHKYNSKKRAKANAKEMELR